MSNVSVAEAKNHLPRLLHQAEAGTPVHITRRGKAVAVLLSESEYAWLSHNRSKPDLFQAILEWRNQAEFDWKDLSPEEVDHWRDRSDRPDFQWPE